MLYLYAWTISLAALALALRFVPYSQDDGELNAGWALVMVAFGLLAVASSFYLVYVLELFKFRRIRERQMRTREQIEEELETGEFEAAESENLDPR